jgi:3',5'-cyclic AMP phosphodiesterase CpdA
MIIRLLVALAVLAALAACGCGSGSGGKASRPSTQPAGATDASAPSDGGARFKFIVCGDPQNNYEVFNRVLEAARSVDFLIIAGDLTGSGTATEFRSFVNAMRSSGVKYYTIPGNHDVATSPVGGNYTTWLGAPYRSFDHKNAHFVLIDNSAQELGFYPGEREWVRQDLKAAGKKGFDHFIAVAHVPPGYPYSSKATRAQIPGIDANGELVPVLSAGGVRELFCGHLHTYIEDRDGGVSVTITGGAGAPLHTFVGGEAVHHYVLVKVNGKQLTKTMIRI